MVRFIKLKIFKISILSLGGLLAWGLALNHAQSGTVELHAHLFMKEGMGWLFTGDFNGPLQARDWRDRFRSTANPASLDQSGNDIVVATLYAHPLFTLKLRDSIRRQLDQADAFVAQHPGWVIARDPSEARAALSVGKKILILALEGAAGILENDEDIAEFIDRRGIRIVTLLHLTDDHLGGVAFLRGLRALSSPIAWISQLFHPKKDSLGVRTNREGLTKSGRALALKLISRHVWLDLSHASDASLSELTVLLESAKQPLLYTHTVLRRYLHAERGISDSALKTVARTKGIIGLMPSTEMLEGTPASGIQALALHMNEAARDLDPASIDLGSDWNGGIPHLEGIWNIGQTANLWAALEKLSPPAQEARLHGVARFLETWDRVFPRGPIQLSNP